MNRPQLFLLHFAGGNRFSFQFMEPYLRGFEVVPLELPGRGRRIGERLLKDFQLAARDIYQQVIVKRTGVPFLLYGHSMGCDLALRVSNLLEAAGHFPAYLVMSGNAGPGTGTVKNRYLLGRMEFVRELERLGGVPPELIENQVLFNFFEPILRADFEISERGDLEMEPAVNVPIYAMMGSREEEAGEIANWARFTRSHYAGEILEGDHFFIYKHPQRIAGIIRDCYGRIAGPVANH
jgi:surfactin synthase thioesterase subunit